MTPSSSHSRALLLLFSLLSLLALCASIEILQNGGADAGNLSGWSFDRDSGAPNRSVLPPPPPLSSSSSSSCFAIRSPFSIISPLVPKNYPPPIFLSSSSLLIIFKGTDTPSYCWSTTGTASVPSKTPVSGPGYFANLYDDSACDNQGIMVIHQVVDLTPFYGKGALYNISGYFLSELQDSNWNYVDFRRATTDTTTTTHPDYRAQNVYNPSTGVYKKGGYPEWTYESATVCMKAGYRTAYFVYEAEYWDYSSHPDLVLAWADSLSFQHIEYGCDSSTYDTCADQPGLCPNGCEQDPVTGAAYCPPPQDCVVLTYDDTPCTKECGGGTFNRSVATTQKEAYGGKPCNFTVQILSCNEFPCQNCTYEWNPWSPCSVWECGGTVVGTRTRTPNITVAPTGDGTPCPSAEEGQCGGVPCPPTPSSPSPPSPSPSPSPTPIPVPPSPPVIPPSLSPSPSPPLASSPSPNTSANVESVDDDAEGANIGLIVGIVVGVVVLLALIVGLIVFLKRRRGTEKKPNVGAVDGDFITDVKAD